MNPDMPDELKSRLKNCLQTILELEPHLAKVELKDYLNEEFDVLKHFINKMESVEIEEEDVRRIEEATAKFLAELDEPLRQRGDSVDKPGPVH